MALLAGSATLRGRKPAALASLHGVPDDDYPAAARILRLAGLPVVACGPGSRPRSRSTGSSRRPRS